MRSAAGEPMSHGEGEEPVVLAGERGEEGGPVSDFAAQAVGASAAEKEEPVVR